MTQRVLVLGGTGMLGTMMVRVLRQQGLAVEHTEREPGQPLPEKVWYFEARAFICLGLSRFDFLREFDWIINCIGVTKPVIDADPRKGGESAIEVNALFPHLLARSLSSHQRLIQIATDCAYSGRTGNYRETDAHDAFDVYGKTKSLGEVNLPNVMHLRTSIIGPEFRKEKRFLLEWFLGQPKGATVNGFTNHYWNGTTTLQFAKICAGIIKNPELFRAGVHHLVPVHGSTKDYLLTQMGLVLGRPDISVVPKWQGENVNRLLETNDPGFNHQLWQGAGYKHPPEIVEMLNELAAWQQPGSPDIVGSR